MMTEYKQQQLAAAQQLMNLTREIAHQLGGGWKVKTVREDQLDYPSRWIVNADYPGAELTVRIGSYGAERGRVCVHGSLHVGRNNSYETVYENGQKVDAPSITVAMDRGAGVIAREIARRMLPEYLRILALAVAQAEKHNAKADARTATMRQLAKLTGGKMPDVTREDSGRVWLGGSRHDQVTVSYGGDSVTFERLSVTVEQAEHIIRYLNGIKA
jgi:hypothetical protein